MIQRITADDLGFKVIDKISLNKKWHMQHGGIIYQVNYYNNEISFFAGEVFKQCIVCLWIKKGIKHRVK